jgi:hypothetical protein
MKVRWLAVLGVLGACEVEPETLTMRGVLWDAPESEQAFAGANVQTLTSDGQNVDKSTSANDGGFTVSAPWGSTLHALVSAPGHVTSSFSGVSGISDTFRLGAGDLHGFPQGLLTTWEEDFAGCEGIGQGSALLGYARFIELADPKTGEHPIVETLAVRVLASDGEYYDACYLNADATERDGDAVEVGPSGKFAVFGLPEGLARVDLVYLFVETSEERYVHQVSYDAWLPADGVAPRFPYWLQVLY